MTYAIPKVRQIEIEAAQATCCNLGTVHCTIASTGVFCFVSKPCRDSYIA